MLLVLAVSLPFIVALLAPLVTRQLGARAGWPLALAFAPGVALATLIPAARSGVPATGSVAWVPGINLSLSFRADGFSLLFALLVAVIGVLVMVYASSYLGGNERHGRFYGYLLLFGGSMLGLVLSDNLIALFAFWELTSISSFLLIGFWDDRRAAQDGALKALVITSAGGLALLAAVILLSLAGGSVQLSQLDFTAIRESSSFVPALLLLLFAALTKSAQFPFHLWLPTAMEAPTPISAYLHSATMVKAGIVLLAKFAPLFVMSAWSDGLLYLGLFTMFWGSYLALRQDDLKALLAYSTVSQLGILTALYGAGYPFAATAHLINHAAFKAALFLVVGIVDHETGSRSVRELAGLGRKLPLTFLVAVPAALSMAGLPPFGGFISKELFYEEMLHAGALPIGVAVAGSVMTFAYSLKFLSVFVGPYRCNRPHVHEAPVWMILPPALLALLVVLFGVFPWAATLATPIVALAAPALGFDAEALYLWHGFTPALTWSFVTWGAGVLLYGLRGPFVRLQRALTPAWNANTLYYAALGVLERAARFATQRTQNASFATQLRLLWLPVALVGVWFALRALGAYLPEGITPVPLEFLAAALLVLAGSYGVVIANTRLAALIFSGLAGLSLVALFVMLRAPDLALTQLLIETVTVILFLSVFRYLPKLTRYRREARHVAFDVLLSGSVGLAVFGALLAVQTPIAARIQDFFLERSKTEGGGYNVVNVILVDFRGYDTLGEITVLAIVGVSVYALLKVKTAPVGEEQRGQEDG
jgi:multicomponent Na+:H+ antiporter subunit A